MLQITIRQSVPRDLALRIPALLEEVISWMQKKYPDVNFSSVEYIFSAGYNRSRYFRNDAPDAKYKSPNACICTRAKLYLYDKKSLGIKKNVLFVGSKLQIACAIVHELTHHIQYEQNIRKGNELDTTRNELEYLKEFAPEYYSKIVATKK